MSNNHVKLLCCLLYPWLSCQGFLLQGNQPFLAHHRHLSLNHDEKFKRKVSLWDQNPRSSLDEEFPGSNKSTLLVDESHPERAVLYREETDEMDCMPPGAVPKTNMVFLISDATGVTARSTMLKILAQFDTCADDYVGGGEDPSRLLCDVQTRTFTFIRSQAALTQILQTAKEKNACVVYTLVDPSLRALASRICTDEDLAHVDVMGPSLQVLGSFLKRQPIGMPVSGYSSAKRRTLGDAYYQRMDAVEFCLKADDGQSPWLLPEADIVLVGVSRCGKTPLSVVMSQTMALKVANIPLVLEVPPPPQLLEVDPRRIFCLTIAPTELRRIRSSRLERRNVKAVEAKYASADADPSTNNYADRKYLLQDLTNARKLAKTYNWTEIDVTGRAVEETATIVVELYNERFGEQLSVNSLR